MAIELDGNNVKAHFKLAKALVQTKEYYEAETKLKRCLALDPSKKAEIEKELARVKALRVREQKAKAKAYSKMFS